MVNGGERDITLGYLGKLSAIGAAAYFSLKLGGQYLGVFSDGVYDGPIPIGNILSSSSLGFFALNYATRFVRFLGDFSGFGDWVDEESGGRKIENSELEESV